jgi:hypothetical protein
MRPWLAVPVVLALGLGVRAFADGDFAKYAGVAFYATLIYALVSFWLRPLWAAITATGISWAVEFFQLTGIPADLSAHSDLAHLVLGSTFNAPDLFWYAVGAALGAAIVRPPNRRTHSQASGHPLSGCNSSEVQGGRPVGEDLTGD